MLKVGGVDQIIIKVNGFKWLDYYIHYLELRGNIIDYIIQYIIYGNIIDI